VVEVVAEDDENAACELGGDSRDDPIAERFEVWDEG
jgi:hypothetical protein